MNTSQHAERVNGAAPAPPQPAAPRRPTRAERLVADAAAKAERARIADEARQDRERRNEEWAAEREQLRTSRRRTRKTSNDYARRERITQWQARAARWWHAFVLVGAIVGVNIVAIVGQVTAFQAPPFQWPMGGAIGAAAVIESIAIFVGWHAHVALIEGDSVMRLRTASYGIAVAVGALNYHHYSSDWGLDDRAVMFGMASVLSPWLWAIHSRHVHRQDLRAKGLIDPRAPKFSALRWVLHRPETWQALKWAVRYGEQSPGAAILAVQTEETTAEAGALLDGARGDLVAAQAALIRAQSDALAVLDETRTETPNETIHEVEIKVSSDPSDSPDDLPDAGGDETADETSTETTDETQATAAMWLHWRHVVEVERRIPTGTELATAGKCTPQWGAKKAREWQAQMDGRTRYALLPRKKVGSVNGASPSNAGGAS